MTSPEAFEEPEGDDAASANTCPRWCFTEHGVHLGEEDWVHASQPVRLADGRMARVCMSIDPDTGMKDGPYVLIGSSELTPDQARTMGESLIRLARTDEARPRTSSEGQEPNIAEQVADSFPTDPIPGYRNGSAGR